MKKVIGILSGFGATLYFSSPVFAAENTILNLCPQDTTGADGGKTAFSNLCLLRPENALPGILTFVLILAVIIALIYLVWGGIKWITSGGDKGNVETARNQIIAAIIGLIVAFLAWFLINLVFQLFFNTSADKIQLPTINVTQPST